MLQFDLIGFFMLGFFGGFGHCIGMCGPLVLYISGRFTGGRKGHIRLLTPHIKYNIGRIVTYGILGAIAGFLGDIGEMAGRMVGMQKIAAVIAGAFLVLYAILSFMGYNLISRLENHFFLDRIMVFMKKLQPKRAFATGLLLGLLPCGLLYSALIAATSSADIVKGAFAMVLFGFGTMVALIITAVFGNILMHRRGVFNMFALLLILGMGVYFIVSGIKY